MLRALVLFVHVAAAVFWIGEMFVLALVVGPHGRTMSPEARSELFHAIGRRSLPLAWLAIALLVGTGFGNLALMGLWPPLLTGALWRTGFGRILAWKLAAVAGMIALSAVHDFVYGRRSQRLRARFAGAEGPERAALAREAERLRLQAARIGRVNLLLGLLVLLLASALVAGS